MIGDESEQLIALGSKIIASKAVRGVFLMKARDLNKLKAMYLTIKKHMKTGPKNAIGRFVRAYLGNDVEWIKVGDFFVNNDLQCMFEVWISDIKTNFMSMFETTFIPFNIDYSAGSRNGSH
jgi:hypothetical protein